MNRSLKIIGYYDILQQLTTYALSEQAKEKIRNLEPLLSELELRKHLRDTTQGRKMLEEIGTPPLPIMENIGEYVKKTVDGNLLLPEQIEQIGIFLVAVKRLISYLSRGKEKQIDLAFYGENLSSLEELQKEIERSIRGGRVDDYASNTLKDIRRELALLEEKINAKAEQLLKANRTFLNDSFVVKRNGRICLPVKKEYRGKIKGSVIDQSATGATLFMEPHGIAQLQEEYDFYKIEEEEEERKILYGLCDQIAEKEVELNDNIRTIGTLDFIFAKGKMSLEMEATEPNINVERYIKLVDARHPMIPKDECVPLQFELGKKQEETIQKAREPQQVRGIIITGPNTGGKTVTIKTVALLSAMACTGLHIPCSSANIAMNNQILCDIGDGQNITDNLSTFSAHIKNVMEILKRVDEESLVIMDELGSGTDPTEGMGIAIAILEQLRMSKALFLVTTHYPEVKEYGERHCEIMNARMAFDRESLQPLYQLEIGKSGESCAIFIAKKLGVPNEMLQIAVKEAYGKQANQVIEQLDLKEKQGIEKVKARKIQKKSTTKQRRSYEREYQRGDSVEVLSSGKIGIVVKPANEEGNVLVQIQREKYYINHKRLRLKVSAKELYPEDYDFSIIFDTVENRKLRHQMEKRHQEGVEIQLEDGFYK